LRAYLVTGDIRALENKAWLDIAYPDPQTLAQITSMPVVRHLLPPELIGQASAARAQERGLVAIYRRDRGCGKAICSAVGCTFDADRRYSFCSRPGQPAAEDCREACTVRNLPTRPLPLDRSRGGKCAAPSAVAALAKGQKSESASQERGRRGLGPLNLARDNHL
jgi:hypothetical protein